MTQPVALTSGDPSGVGLELSGQAWQHLKTDVPFFLIADHAHVLNATDVPTKVIDKPSDAIGVMQDALPVIHLPFSATPKIGTEHPQNAGATIQSIEMA
ncbi:MAG: 4-hydroxythreonine-4-phosphate dehydrogenase, partial [Proteobacteria bacterium]|nr:4-hydroxythreonine-4-phosphate dehydrogenase [Pseudomonadota bacterium]